MGVAASHLSPRHRRFFDQVKQGQRNEVVRAAERNPNLVLRHHTLSRHETAMHFAAAGGHAQVLTDLLQLAEAALQSISPLRALVNSINDRRQTPLMLAAYNGHVECVKLLLEHGADPWLVDSLGRRTALHYAALRNHHDIAMLLVHAANHHAGSVSFPNCVNTKYVDVRTLSGHTALHYAALSGAVDAARALMDQGANIIVGSLFDSFDVFAMPSGSTPLHMAARMGHTSLAKALLQGHAEAWGSRQAPDPRRVHNAMGVLPAALAGAMGHDDLQHILLPSTPLAAIFSADELQLYGPPKLQLLAAVALRAHLQAALSRAEGRLRGERSVRGGRCCPPHGGAAALSVHELACEGIQQEARHLADQRQQDKQGLAKAEGVCGGDGCCSTAAAPVHCSPQPLLPVPLSGGAAHDAAAAEAVVQQQAGSDPSCSGSCSGACPSCDDDCCCVCLDAAADVVLAPCAHHLCAACCSRLLRMDYQDSALCPFCRAPIGDLHALCE